MYKIIAVTKNQKVFHEYLSRNTAQKASVIKRIKPAKQWVNQQLMNNNTNSPNKLLLAWVEDPSIANDIPPIDVLNELVDKDADMNTTDLWGTPALNIAAYKGNLEMMRRLIRAGADVDARNKKNGFTALLEAVHFLDTEVAKFLIEYGAEVNAQNNHGSTALHGAAANGIIELVNFLIVKGAEVNTQNNLGSTALHGAARYGKTDVVKLLLCNRADVTVKNNNGQTALQLAARYGKTEVVKLLLCNGADQNTTVNNQPIFDWAIRNKHLDIA